VRVPARSTDRADPMKSTDPCPAYSARAVRTLVKCRSTSTATRRRCASRTFRARSARSSALRACAEAFPDLAALAEDCKRRVLGGGRNRHATRPPRQDGRRPPRSRWDDRDSIYEHMEGCTDRRRYQHPGLRPPMRRRDPRRRRAQGGVPPTPATRASASPYLQRYPRERL
jgi:hypothetical protein